MGQVSTSRGALGVMKEKEGVYGKKLVQQKDTAMLAPRWGRHCGNCGGCRRPCQAFSTRGRRRHPADDSCRVPDSTLSACPAAGACGGWSAVWSGPKRLELLSKAICPPDTIVIGPRQLRISTESFVRHARGDMVWFRVCLLMFKTPSLFDTLLCPAIENPVVAPMHCVLDVGRQPLWNSEVVPKNTPLPGVRKSSRAVSDKDRGKRCCHPVRDRTTQDDRRPVEFLERAFYIAGARAMMFRGYRRGA